MAPDFPTGAESGSAVWTGSELINFTSFLRYDAAKDLWSKFPTPSCAGGKCRVAGDLFWTGSEVLLFWGDNTDGLAPFLAFDPVRNEWSSLPTAGIHWDDLVGFPAWIGDSLLVITRNDDGSRVASRFFPATETWLGASATGLPEWEAGASGCWDVWTGERLMRWGATPPQGASYDPRRDEWRPMATDGIQEHTNGVAVWTGSEVVVWGRRPSGRDGFQEAGSAYDPETLTWRPLTADGVPRAGHAMVWTGCEVVVWGGWNLGGEGGLDSGFVLRP